jgi:hypothetical protein
VIGWCDVKFSWSAEGDVTLKHMFYEKKYNKV